MTIFWVHSGRAATDGRGLAWHDWHDATRDQRESGARGGIGTALPDDNHRQKIPSMLYALRTDMVNN